MVLVLNPDNHVRLDELATNDAFQGQGRAALSWLCAQADRFGMTLYLYPAPLEGRPVTLSRGQLAEWYARRGFAYQPFSPFMARPPRRERHGAGHGRWPAG